MLLNGRDRSPFTRRVAVSMIILGIPFDRQRLTAWEHLENVRQYNPLGRVPSLVLEDGEVLVDSYAILDYIDEVVGPERALIPSNGLRRREVLKYVSCAVGVMEKAAHSRYEVVMRPAEKIHQPWLDHNRQQMENGLHWLDAAAESSWVFNLEPMTQALISTIVAYDFMPFVDPELVTPGKYLRLESLRAEAYNLHAFADTDPTKEK